jgi:GntR family transcriptional regulator/MocR family aminotransferase
MRTRSRSTFLPLDRGPASAGLSLRALIRRSCLEAIVGGRLGHGERLPSARQLARDWHVSRTTVDDALAALQSEGVIERRVGAGTFVTFRVDAQASARWRPWPPSALGRDALAQLSRWGRVAAEVDAPHAAPRARAFVAGLPDVRAFPHALWRRIVARRLRDDALNLAAYLPPLGLPALQQATARHLAAFRGLVCDPAQILVLNSTMQAADLIARVLLERGRRAWIEDPCYPNLRSSLALSGATLVPVPVDAEGLDVDAGIARAPDAALAYVTPACHYPLGMALSHSRRQALLDWAARGGAWIVEDDYQSEFFYDARAPAPLASLGASERVLHIGTFTNAVFPSLRLAYVVLPPPLVDVFAAVRGQLDGHTHGLAQAALAEFIDGGHFAAHLRRMRNLYAQRRDALVHACERELPAHFELGPCNAGMSAPLRDRRRRPDRELAAEVAKAGVQTLPLSRYAIRSRAWRGLLLGFTGLDESAVRNGVSRLARALRNAGR